MIFHLGLFAFRNLLILQRVRRLDKILLKSKFSGIETKVPLSLCRLWGRKLWTLQLEMSFSLLNQDEFNTEIKSDANYTIFIRWSIEVISFDPEMISKQNKLNDLVNIFSSKFDMVNKPSIPKSSKETKFDFFKSNSITMEFIRKSTPMTIMWNDGKSIFSWENPKRTIIFGLSITFALKFTNLTFFLLIIGILFIIKPMTKYLVLPEETQIDNYIDSRIKEVQSYIDNMKYIQEQQLIYLKIYDFFNSKDKTELFDSLKFFKRNLYLVLLSLLFVSFVDLIIIGIWLLLIYQLESYKQIITSIINNVKT